MVSPADYIARAYVALDEAGIREDVIVDLNHDSTGFFSDKPMVRLNYIEVPEAGRGAGLGTKVMTVLTRLADELQVTLILRAGSEDGEALFHKFGFDGDGRMIRKPTLPSSASGL